MNKTDAITPELIKQLQESHDKEVAFFERHGFEYSLIDDKTGKATLSRLAWVKAVELEYDQMGKDVRVHLDTPIARKAFILGYLYATRREKRDSQ